MAKCKVCNSCLIVFRVDELDKSTLMWYCDLCDKIYDWVFRKSINNQEWLQMARDWYKERWGAYD